MAREEAGSVLRPRARQAVPIRHLAGQRLQNVDVGKSRERLCHSEPFGLREWIGRPAAKTKFARLSELSRLTQDRDAIFDQRVIGLAGAVPFDQREFGMVQRAPLAVAKGSGELDDAPLTRRQ